MILTSFFKALGQLGDPRFRRVFWAGIGLTLALLAAITMGFVWLAGLFLPDAVTLPWIGEVGWIDNVVSWAILPLMLILSVFLMVPVASAFTGLFLDQVTDAVEERHYPALARAPAQPISDALVDSLRFLGLLIAANLVAVALYVMMPPLAPIIFWALNGFLLGREYFQMVAGRRLGPVAARKAWRRHLGTIWLAGGLMAIPLSIPVVNLLIPILGAATFTHLFHGLDRSSG